MVDLPPVVSINDVADYFKVSRTTIFREVKSGRLKSYKLGNQRRIKREWVVEYENSMIANEKGVMK